MAYRLAENQIWNHFFKMLLLHGIKCLFCSPYFAPGQGPHPWIDPVEGLPVLQAQGQLDVGGLITVCPEQYYVLSPPFPCHLTHLTCTAGHCQD